MRELTSRIGTLPSAEVVISLRGIFDEKHMAARFGGTVPAFGMYARHVKGITLRNVDISTKAADGRPAVVFLDVAGAKLADAPEPDKRQEHKDQNCISCGIDSCGLANLRGPNDAARCGFKTVQHECSRGAVSAN